jgi:hypothetical protein
MAIVPETLQKLIEMNLKLLEIWFSQRLYALIEKNSPRHVLVRMQAGMDLSKIEQACQRYHHQAGPGAKPTHTVKRLVRALLVKYMYNLSLRETEERIRYDLMVKWYVGYGVFEEVLDHSSLERFEQWVSRECHRVFFDEILKQIDAAFPEESEAVQIGDTFAMAANAAQEGIVDLLRHTSRCLLSEIEQGAPEQLAQVLKEVEQSLLFGAEDEAPGYLLNEEQRQMRRLHTLQGVWQLRQALKPLLPSWKERMQIRVGLRLEDLEKIVQDEYAVECDASGKPVVVKVLAKKDKGSYRLGSATDPEATCRNHGGDRTLGYNVSLAISRRAIIREIQAATGSTPDQAGVAALLAAQDKCLGVIPAKLLFDRAAGMGRTRAEVARVSRGRTVLVSHVPPQADNGRFGPDKFHFNTEGKLVCPQGRCSTSSYHREDRDGDTYEFSAKVCADCPLWKDCRDPKASASGERRVFISDYQNQIREAEAYNQTPEFKQEMKQRPLVERVIFMLTNYDGARRARSRGVGRADFQAKMCATARNLRTWLSLSLRKEAGGGLHAA